MGTKSFVGRASSEVSVSSSMNWFQPGKPQEVLACLGHIPIDDAYLENSYVIFLVVTCFNIGRSCMLPKKGLHRSLQVLWSLKYIARTVIFGAPGLRCASFLHFTKYL